MTMSPSTYPTMRRILRMLRLQRALPAIHPMSCNCGSCPTEPLSVRFWAWLRTPFTPANRWAFETFAGLALGLAVAWIFDRAIGGPGILIIFGVGS